MTKPKREPEPEPEVDEEVEANLGHEVGRSPSAPSSSTSSRPKPAEHELQRKRARDRKSQQAMRDRAKWTVDNLTQQVHHLNRALEHETQQAAHLHSRVYALERENDLLRAENAALQMRILGTLSATSDTNSVVMSPVSAVDGPAGVVDTLPDWRKLPLNHTPVMLTDQILMGFVGTQLKERRTETAVTRRPDLRRLINQAAERKGSSNPNDVVLDIIKSYREIDTLPKQVAVHFLVYGLIRWMMLQSEASWREIPVWLRPIPEQISTPHPAWLDRIPWPSARRYLVEHPEIGLDDFAAVYSQTFDVSWNYDPASVLISLESGDVVINPVYEEHISHLANWTVAGRFVQRFPVMGKAIERDCQDSRRWMV